MWSAKRDTPGSRRLTSLRTLKACEETPRSPSGCAAWQERTRGCARFTRLTPGYSPCTPYRGADSRPDATSLAIGSIGLVGFHGVLALEFVLGIQERSHS